MEGKQINLCRTNLIKTILVHCLGIFLMLKTLEFYQYFFQEITPGLIPLPLLRSALLALAQGATSLLAISVDGCEMALSYIPNTLC